MLAVLIVSTLALIAAYGVMLAGFGGQTGSHPVAPAEPASAAADGSSP
jgi:hypothetical protein